VRLELTDSFQRDRDRLTPAERQLVRDGLPDFVAACDRIASDPAAGWPASLRVKDVEGAPGIFEITFNFVGPDLRATFEWTRIDGARAVRWRRIGGHAIFKQP
jgi:hypothetical protein